MKILALDQFSELGGAQQCLLELLPALRENGWTGTIAMPGEGEMFARVRAEGFDAVRIECGSWKSAPDVARFVADTPRLAREVGRLARGADLIYVNGPRLLPACALAGVAPVVFHAHRIVPRPAREMAGVALRRLRARVIANCEFVARSWRSWTKNVEVVYNGVGGSKKRDRTEACPTIGIIGRIAPEKGQLAFVQAASVIHRVVPQCRFVVYGAGLFSGAEYEQEVRAAAAGLPIEFPGWVTDVYAALQNLDLLLVPSDAAEATTRVILEAFAAGVPVVAFRAGGIPEVVEDGVDGCLVTSAEEMAAAAVRLLSGDRTRMIEAARETWQRRFTLDRWRQDLIRILNSAAAAPAITAAPVSTGP